uniref:Uncharacterized protein n=1 Tax=Parascaris univalens TaxID=6257 RepID=A0A915C8N6_PARUN
MQPKRQQIKGTAQKVKGGGRIAKKEEKFTLLFQIYNKVIHEVKKLSNREVPIGDEYNETHEEQQEERLRKLSKRALRLHEYLVRKGRIVDSSGQKLKLEEPPVLNITKTGNQFLDEAITNHINQRHDGIKGFKLHCGRKSYLTIDELKEMVEQLRKEGKLTDCPEDEEEMRQFLIDKYDSIWQQEKDFIIQQVREKLDDYKELNYDNGDSFPIEEEQPHDGPSTLQGSSCSYEIAMMEMARAVEDGSLAVSEKDGGDISTASGEDDMASDDEDEVTEECVSENEEGLLEDEENSEDELIDLDSSDDDEKSDYRRKMEQSSNLEESCDAKCDSDDFQQEKTEKMDSDADEVSNAIEE